MKSDGFSKELKEKVMTLGKFMTHGIGGWLAGTAAALGIAVMLTGCVVVTRPAYGYQEHWHGWHEWR